MTLQDAIKHLEEMLNSGDLKDCAECEAEHRQLLEWLKDYQSIKERFNWTPAKVRPSTEEGQKILVSRNGHLDFGNAINEDGFYLDDWGDWYTADAWMPLPEPFRKFEQLEKGEKELL